MPTLNPGYDLEIIDGNNSRRTSKRELLYRHPPFFIIFISIFQLFSFVYYAFRADEPLSLVGPVPFKSKLIYDPRRRYEIWRYLTYMFIHAGYWHISFNLLIQLAVGVPLEIVHKFNPILIIYTGGVVGGALGNSIVDPHSYLAGASSGCYALITAHLANLIINWKELKGPCLELLTLIAFTLADFGTAVYERHYKLDSIAYRTSYGGHIAGAASGLLLGLVFLRNARIHNWERVVQHVAATIYLTLTVSIFAHNQQIVAIAFNIFYKDFFPLPDSSELIWAQSPYMRDRE